MNAKQKNLVTLLAAAVAACGLGLYAYFGVMKPEVQQTERKEVDTKLFAVHAPGERGADGGAPTPPVFTKISVEMPESKTLIELQDGLWRVTSPVSSRADKEQVDNLISQLASAKFKSTLDENPTDADLERYGLKPPRVTVSAHAYVPDAQGGGKDDPARQHSVTFHMGIENSFDGTAYVRREGDPRVYLAEGALRFVLQKSTQEWRDKQAFPVEEPTLLRIEVKARKNTFTLERATTEKPWQLARSDMRVDAERVTKMVQQLRDQRVHLFPDAATEAKVRQALEKPLVEATFVPKLGAPMRVRMTELAVDKLKHAYVLTEWGPDSVLAQVDPATLDVLDLPALELKDKKALTLDASAVQLIIVHPAPGAETLKLTKAPDTGRWEVVAPTPGLAREFKVASLLGSLEKLKGAAITESRPKSWSRYGITDTSRGVSLMDGTGQLVARLWIGNEVKGNPQRVWARGASEDVLELDKSAVDALPLALADLMDGMKGEGSKGAPAANGSP